VHGKGGWRGGKKTKAELPRLESRKYEIRKAREIESFFIKLSSFRAFVMKIFLSYEFNSILKNEVYEKTLDFANTPH
jgi:hypothetical protein